MAKKKRLKDEIEQIEDHFKKLNLAYIKAYDELVGFEGVEYKTIGMDKVNEMFHNIQSAFIELWPVLDFVQRYSSKSKEMLQSYTTFIETLRKQGVMIVKDNTTEA